MGGGGLLHRGTTLSSGSMSLLRGGDPMLGWPPPPPHLSLHGVSCPSEGSLIPLVLDPGEVACPIGGAVSLPLSCQRSLMSCQRSRRSNGAPWGRLVITCIREVNRPNFKGSFWNLVFTHFFHRPFKNQNALWKLNTHYLNAKSPLEYLPQNSYSSPKSKPLHS